MAGSSEPSFRPLADSAGWTARRFFTLLGELGRLRVISRSGPSTFEALCTVGPFEIAHGFVNALFFALAERADEPPFLRIYLHREKGEEFGAAREARFGDAHGALRDGVAVEPEADH